MSTHRTEVSSTIIPIGGATIDRLFPSFKRSMDRPPVAMFAAAQPTLTAAWVAWRAQQEPKPVAFIIDDQTGEVTLQMEYGNAE